MADSGEGLERSPFSKPGFIVSALVVALVLVLGVGVIIGRRSDDDSGAADATADPTGSAGVSTTTNAGGTSTDGDASICGLEGEVLEPADLDLAPTVDDWEYQGTTAYPVSAVYGPAATDASGYRYCFQHSPEGALFAAANALTQGSDSTNSSTWIEYFLAEGPYRDELLADEGESGTTSDMRLKIVGFKILAYDGEVARVDLAFTGLTSGRTTTFSGVYELVWQNEDWKISADVPQPVDVIAIPDTVGYVSWQE